VPGRQIPQAPLRVPRHRRLEEVTLVVDQERSAARAGTDGELDLRLLFGQHPALRVLSHLPVHDLVAPALNAIVKTEGPEFAILRRVALFRETDGAHGRKGAAHWMLAVRAHQFRMAAGARLITDVLDLRADVAIGRRNGESRVAGRSAGWRARCLHTHVE